MLSGLLALNGHAEAAHDTEAVQLSIEAAQSRAEIILLQAEVVDPEQPAGKVAGSLEGTVHGPRAGRYECQRGLCQAQCARVRMCGQRARAIEKRVCQKCEQLNERDARIADAGLGP